MTRTIFPMAVADMSAFAKSFREQLVALDHKPSHVEMLNLLSRAAGFKNYQHFRASAETAAVPPAEESHLSVTALHPAEPEPMPNEARVAKMLRLFDREGKLIRWPTKRAQQELCLWLLWSKIPRGEEFSERGISKFLNGFHLFGDAALLRRDLFDLGLVTRKRDGSGYRRIERKPPAELRLLASRIGTGRAVAA
jgi:hypothetical protein